MRVLFVDDNVEKMTEAIESLKAAGMEVIPMAGFSQFSEHLKKDEPFDVVVLDWLLDGSSPVQAKGCLDLLREYRFVPVVIYTEHKDDFQGDESVSFPKSCVLPCGKNEVLGADLGKLVSDWDKSFLAGRISQAWRKASRSSVERVLYDLASMDEGGVQSALTVMTKSEAGEAPDVDHALELLHRMGGRHVGGNPDLRALVEGVLRAAKDVATGGRERIWSHHMYYVPGDKLVRAGDVVEWGPDGMEKRLGLVLTPACDLSQCKTFFVRIIGLSTWDAQGGDQFLRLPNVPLGPKKLGDLCASFHDVTTIQNKSIYEKFMKMRAEGQKSMKLPPIHMRYDHAYVDAMGRAIAWKPIARVDDPYRSDVFQKFSSHASRIGIPDVPHV